VTPDAAIPEHTQRYNSAKLTQELPKTVALSVSPEPPPPPSPLPFPLLQASSGAITSLGTVALANLATARPDVYVINGQVGAAAHARALCSSL
jgi:hypothetical protein